MLSYMIMNALRLVELNGMPVYFSHKFSIDDHYATRFSRGVIYGGICYDISFGLIGRPGIPALLLKMVDTELIEEIAPLKEEQQIDIEKEIAQTLRTRLEGRIKLTMPLIFSGNSNSLKK